jgi:hypothetical protein
MITADFIIILFLAIIFGVVAVYLLSYGIYKAIIEYNFSFFFGAVCGFLFLSSISNFFFYEAYKEYQNAIPQNQVKILKQKISDAEKELQKYLIDHPELEAEER